MNTKLTISSCLTILALSVCPVVGVCQATSSNESTIEIEKAIIRVVESVDVPFQREGVVRELNLQEGTVVKQGQVVGKIDNSAFGVRLEKAKLDHEIAKRRSSDDTLIQYARKTAEVALAELRRAEIANRSVRFAISDTEMDRLKLVYAKSKLEIDKAKIDFDVAKLTEQQKSIEISEIENEMARHLIKSPIDGLVVNVENAVGEWVNSGDRAFRVVRMDKLRIEAQIDVDLATMNLVGKPATIGIESTKGKKLTAQGKVVFVSPEANPVNRKVAVWIEFDNTDGEFRPGLHGNVKIHLNHQIRLIPIGR